MRATLCLVGFVLIVAGSVPPNAGDVCVLAVWVGAGMVFAGVFLSVFVWLEKEASRT